MGKEVVVADSYGHYASPFWLTIDLRLSFWYWAVYLYFVLVGETAVIPAIIRANTNEQEGTGPL